MRPTTDQQRRVLRGIAAGLRNKEIAAKLKISESGVRRHIEALARRYKVSGRTALMRAAVEAGDLVILRGPNR